MASQLSSASAAVQGLSIAVQISIWSSSISSFGRQAPAPLPATTKQRGANVPPRVCIHLLGKARGWCLQIGGAGVTR